MYGKIKEQITMRDLFTHYGFKTKNNRIACPLHGGKHYSLGFNNNTFNCFKCGVKGTVIDFVSQYEGLSLYDSAILLSNTFNLNIPTSKPNDFNILRAKIRKLTI